MCCLQEVKWRGQRTRFMGVKGNEMKDELSGKSSDELVLGLWNFNRHVWKETEGFEGVHGRYGISERNAEGRMLLEFCDEKEVCAANTWFQKKHNRKQTFKAGEFATEIDFVLIGKEQRKYLKDIKTIPWELQQRLIVDEVDKKKLKKTVKMKRVVRRRQWKLKEDVLKRKARKEG